MAGSKLRNHTLVVSDIDDLMADAFKISSWNQVFPWARTCRPRSHHQVQRPLGIPDQAVTRLDPEPPRFRVVHVRLTLSAYSFYLNLGSRAMPRTFKVWTPSAAELELLHECWLARLPPARIAVRLGISEPKLKRFVARVHAARDMPRPEPARLPPSRLQAPSRGADRLVARVFGV